MTEEHHPVDDLLRAYTEAPAPDPSDRAYAEAHLNTAIRDEAQESTRRGRWPILVWTAGLLVLVIGILFVIEAGRTTPAEAAMEEIARLAESTDPLTATDTQYVYTRSEVQNLGVIPREDFGDVPYDADQLVYLAHSTRETWFGNQGTVQLRTMVHQPSFFNEKDQQVYYAAGLDDLDQVGETITTTVTEPDREEWPTDPDELDRAIRERMVTNRGLPETVEYLDVALDIVGESFGSPELRATTLRLIGSLDSLRLVGKTQDGSVTFSVDYVDRGVETRHTFNIDRAGYLRFDQILTISANNEFGIPADTAIYETQLAPSRITGSIDLEGLRGDWWLIGF